ncbi:MAG: hypothetical protein MASP_00464 [Candidatus Methanolliviera sp. GoM_asphalt]|nr:MAG: hypothetical protein MASP_00464 [Candidatus Methanolliviera sp. GoM_asphalt]
MGINKLKKFAIDLLIRVALSDKSDFELKSACYEELLRRRKIDKKDRKKLLLINASSKKLIKLAKENAMRNPNISRLCYGELIWRDKIDEIRGVVEIETALQKLDKILEEEG